jgi:hypothetical protein
MKMQYLANYSAAGLKITIGLERGYSGPLAIPDEISGLAKG